MSEPEADRWREVLTAEVRRRFGAERAETLAPDIAIMARHLAAVAAAELPEATEPGFYLGP